MTTGQNVTPQEVAQWMYDEIRQRGVLFWRVAVYEIEQRFGPGFVSEAESGNPAIDPRVLKAFRKLHGGTVSFGGLGRLRRWRLKPDASGTRDPGTGPPASA